MKNRQGKEVFFFEKKKTFPCLTLLSALFLPALAHTVPPVLSAYQFVNAIGVDTHISYTDGLYSNLPLVISDMRALGIDQVRDGIGDGANGSAPFSSYVTLAQAGIHFTVGIDGVDDHNNAAILRQLALVDRLEEMVPGSVTAIAGANEINNGPVTYTPAGGKPETGIAAAVAQQADLYADVHADETLAGVPVIYFTGYFKSAKDTLGPDPMVAPVIADFDDQHPYPGYFKGSHAPAAWASRNCGATSGPMPYPNLGAQDCQTAPGVFSETGYSTSSGGTSPVTDQQKADYEPDLLFDAIDPTEGNVARVDLYDLMDAYASGSRQGDDLWGLFAYAAGAQKFTPAATNIAHIVKYVADTDENAGSFVPAAVDYTITGMPPTGHCLLIEQSNGTYILAIWAEPAVLTTTATVTAHFPSVSPDISVYDPVTGKTSTSHNARSIALTVSAYPVLVKFTQ